VCGPISSSATDSTQTQRSALALERHATPAAVDTRVVFKLGQWLRYVDNLDGARRRLDEAERSARMEEGDDSSLANILLNRVIVECWAGAWPEATELADRWWTPRAAWRRRHGRRGRGEPTSTLITDGSKRFGRQ
jgi:hypothetical protein